MNNNLIRIFDIVISTFSLLILSPLILIISILIFLIDGRPIIYKQIRIGGYVKKNSFLKKSSEDYEFTITDNKNEVSVFYKGILPDLFREGQGIVIEGLIKDNNFFKASKVYTKHDENYMPASIKQELEKNNQWKKKYK